MKIVIVVRHFFPFTRPSGITSYIRELITELKSYEDVELSLLCLKKTSEGNYYEYEGIPVYKFKSLSFISYRQKIIDINPDKVIHVSGTSSGLVLFVWWLILLVSAKKYETYFLQATNFQSVSSRLTGYILSCYNGLIVSSSSLENHFKQVWNLSSEKVLPGLSEKGLLSLRKSNRQQITTIGFFGHVSYVKGIDRILTLAKECPEYDFCVVAGSCSGTDKSNSLMSEFLGQCDLLDNLKFHQEIQDPYSVMKTCDILVLPFRTGGTVLGVAQSAIEAMAMGIPVLGTKNSALEDIIIDGHNGYFTQNLEDIKSRLSFLKNNPKVYLELSLNARSTVSNLFSIKKSASDLLEKIK